MKDKSIITIKSFRVFCAILSFAVFCAIFYFAVCPVCTKGTFAGKSLFGRAEEIYIFKQKLKFRAKLDTGAKSSSLSAVNIQEFERDGKIWVSFRVMDQLHQKYVQKKFPLERYARIKQHLNARNRPTSIKRPVVLLPVCLGTEVSYVEVNLVDRDHFKYPVLLGRDALIKFNAVVDSAKKFTVSPSCEAMS